LLRSGPPLTAETSEKLVSLKRRTHGREEEEQRRQLAKDCDRTRCLAMSRLRETEEVRGHSD
jgi:hypothetical protein